MPLRVPPLLRRVRLLTVPLATMPLVTTQAATASSGSVAYHSLGCHALGYHARGYHAGRHCFVGFGQYFKSSTDMDDGSGSTVDDGTMKDRFIVCALGSSLVDPYEVTEIADIGACTHTQNAQQRRSYWPSILSSLSWCPIVFQK